MFRTQPGRQHLSSEKTAIRRQEVKPSLQQTEKQSEHQRSSIKLRNTGLKFGSPHSHLEARNHWWLWHFLFINMSGDILISHTHTHTHTHTHGFPSSSDGKESACNAGDLALILELGSFTGEGNGYPVLYSWLENSMDRGVWRAIVHGVTKSQT